MSVTTTSDRKREEAKEKLREAVKIVKEAQELLSEAIDDDTWGSNDYKEEYKDTLIALESEVVAVRITINNIIRKI